MNDAQVPSLEIGSVFHGRYEVIRRLQTGGMGAVYECIDGKTRRRRALKVMLPSLVADAGFRERFQREATVTAEIESDHILETFDADIDLDTGAPYLVTELLRGEDLGQVLERRGALTPDEAVVLLQQAAIALARTHAAGVVHRDLKPENLFLAQGDDGAPKLKILDFGIAKVFDAVDDAKSTQTLGTPLYMAPEQITGDARVGPPADVFAVGHIAYALLVGEAYWAEDAETLAIYALFSRMLKGAQEPASARALRRRNVVLPRAFDAWFQRATHFDAATRFASAPAAVAALAMALQVGDDPRVEATLFDRHERLRSSPSTSDAPVAIRKTPTSSLAGGARKASPRSGWLTAVTLLAAAAFLVAVGVLFRVSRAQALVESAPPVAPLPAIIVVTPPPEPPPATPAAAAAAPTASDACSAAELPPAASASALDGAAKPRTPRRRSTSSAPTPAPAWDDDPHPRPVSPKFDPQAI